MTNTTNRNRQLYEVAKFYKDKGVPVHVTFSSNKFANGVITFLEVDRMLLEEEDCGEILILFERIADDGIVPRKPRETNERN